MVGKIDLVPPNPGKPKHAHAATPIHNPVPVPRSVAHLFERGPHAPHANRGAHAPAAPIITAAPAPQAPVTPAATSTGAPAETSQAPDEVTQPGDPETPPAPSSESSASPPAAKAKTWKDKVQATVQPSAPPSTPSA